MAVPYTARSAERFNGQYYRGQGDVEYLQLLDIARRMFAPDPEFQNLAMLYNPEWNGLVEGPTWKAWWTQNSYGPTYCALPFYQEPFVTFLQNAQDLWFDQMGDGKTRRATSDWVAPDGCLCDWRCPGWFVSKQGDGRIDIHDWALEFTAAGMVNAGGTAADRPRPEGHSSNICPSCGDAPISSKRRRDPKNNLFLAGPAANLLAPSYAGWKKPDGTYDKAYLTGLSITYIVALDRLIELEKLAGNAENVQLYSPTSRLGSQGAAAGDDRRGILHQVARSGRHEARRLRGARSTVTLKPSATTTPSASAWPTTPRPRRSTPRSRRSPACAPTI